VARPPARVRSGTAAAGSFLRPGDAGSSARCAAGPVDEAAGRWGAPAQAESGDGRGHWPRPLGGGDVVSQSDQRPHAAPLPRPGSGGSRIARGAPASLGFDYRSPRTSGVPRSPCHAARPGLCARPHVHVLVLHVRMGPAARRDLGAVDFDSPRSGAARRFRAADGAHLNVAAWRRTRHRGARRLRQPVGAAPLRDRHHRAAR
jgi:hypothetical protein